MPATSKTRVKRARVSGGFQGSAPQMQREPSPPFAKQKQHAPGLESKLDPKPRYEAPQYKAAGKLRRQMCAHHRRRFGYRTRRGCVVCARGR